MMLEKVKMKNKTLKIAAQRSDLGFTAIEIAMVAAVIAILSLIALPLFRNRVDDAKVAAARADLSALMKAEQVVKADTGYYVRLEDLDNIQELGYESMPPNGVNKEVPWFRYQDPSKTVSPDPTTRHDMTLIPGERKLFAVRADGEPRWRGPYIAFQNAILYRDFSNASVFEFYDQFSVNGANGLEAAIQDDASKDHEENRIPVDPWGNPYMFFPPSGNVPDPTAINGAYSSSAIYSLGPDGLPGDGGAAAANYTRAFAVNAAPTVTDVLGKGDDLMVEF